MQCFWKKLKFFVRVPAALAADLRSAAKERQLKQPVLNIYNLLNPAFAIACNESA